MITHLHNTGVCSFYDNLPFLVNIHYCLLSKSATKREIRRRSITQNAHSNLPFICFLIFSYFAPKLFYDYGTTSEACV